MNNFFSADAYRFGLRFTGFPQLANWGLLEITSEIPFEIQPNCPCDGETLKTIATLVGEQGHRMIRIGSCPVCGYKGYIDRPKADWMRRYYSVDWESEEGDKQDENIGRRKLKCSIPIGARGIEKESAILRLVRTLTLDRSRPLCELGCGNGGELHALESLGFSTLVGVEPSVHRAETARQAYGLQVLTGTFDEERVQSELARISPFGLFFSRHVLEHVYNPSEILELIARLQKPGDYVIFSVPQGQNESAITTLLFLPHLHGFTPLALRSLLAHAGYEIVDDSYTNEREIVVVARKIGKR